jgi:hypothetical protein
MYAEEDVGVFTDMFTTAVAPHGVFAGKLTPVYNSADHSKWRPWHGKYDL